ncbi:MAG: hypothetical protein K0A89_04070 [ANME-2 cluster archaeon]|nr:hypothetical protein [ANME-2 cluster archaeon]MDW7776089.1 hypothetical protein [Methanosarcinales archaeon]
MPERDNPECDTVKLTQKRREFEKACCDYMEEFGFEWVEEFTLNGA